MTGFTLEQLSSETLSELLLRLRKEQNLSCEDVAEITKIHIDHIVALESGNMKSLPSDVYARGFLRSLSRAYKVDADVLLHQFHKEQSVRRRVKGESQVSKTALLPASRKFIPRLIITPRFFLLAFVALFFVVVFGYLVYQIGSFASAPTLVLDRPDRDLTIDGSSITVIGTTDPTVGVLINGEDIFVDPSGHFSTELALQDGVNTLTVVARNTAGKETVVVRNIFIEK